MGECTGCDLTGGDDRPFTLPLDVEAASLSVGRSSPLLMPIDYRGGVHVTVRVGSGHVRVEHPANDRDGASIVRLGADAEIGAGHRPPYAPPLLLLRDRGESGRAFRGTAPPDFETPGCHGACVPVQIVGHAAAGLVRPDVDVIEWILENGTAVQRAKEKALADHDRKLAAGFQGEPYCLKPGCDCVNQYTTYPPRYSFAFTPMGRLGTVVGVHCTTSWTGTCDEGAAGMP